MKIHLEKALFINRAPFDKLELNFKENEIAVLSAVNGKGKTTILSHIVDAFHEMAKTTFRDFAEKRDQYYRVSTSLYNLDRTQSSFVYLRFKTDNKIIDYIDVRNVCTEEQYNKAITIENKIPFNQLQANLERGKNIKKLFPVPDVSEVQEIFSKNILTYFPSYRYEIPGYINDPYKMELSFRKKSEPMGFLNNPIEVVSGLPSIANWIMDIALDLRGGNAEHLLLSTFKNLNQIITQTLISKNYGSASFGIGPRGFGSTRIQIVEEDTKVSIYPSIFSLSSGEASMLCIFGELLRQADKNKNNILLQEITGIVLIDEADKHLHIKLQKEVLPFLFKLFPKVQFIVSSHSPFLSMGLAETAQERSKIIDLDNFGIIKDLTTNAQYTEVYNMMVNENERFKECYESLKSQIDGKKSLQIVTEGKNNAHIKKAIEILDSNLIDKINFIEGAEDKTGKEQLKKAFDVMSNCIVENKFLFVWDCDAQKEANGVVETSTFFRYLFPKNKLNTAEKKGIENLYPLNCFDFDDENIFPEKPTFKGSHKKTTVKELDKSKFLEKVQGETDTEIFENYRPLIDKIKDIISPQDSRSSTE